jgi:hypothetical protein
MSFLLVEIKSDFKCYAVSIVANPIPYVTLKDIVTISIKLNTDFMVIPFRDIDELFIIHLKTSNKSEKIIIDGTRGCQALFLKKVIRLIIPKKMNTPFKLGFMGREHMVKHIAVIKH